MSRCRSALPTSAVAKERPPRERDALRKENEIGRLKLEELQKLHDAVQKRERECRRELIRKQSSISEREAEHIRTLDALSESKRAHAEVAERLAEVQDHLREAKAQLDRSRTDASKSSGKQGGEFGMGVF